ncbi:MAG: epoxyqueuosine reductase QueH [Lentisphaeria bacterium]|nr:epoxyqueuosine reductase QueH [Lentisphaeria bacterium]
MKDLLLHICCAPCGGGCVDRPEMIAPGRRVELFYSNSNLDTAEEFARRLAEVRKLAAYCGLALTVDPYDHAAWLRAVAGSEAEPEGGARCRKCFDFSLRRTAERAAGSGRAFATTLTVSPRKSSRVLFDVGSQWADFEPIDFKKKDGYLRGCRFAAAQGYYRQNYCGCEFSRRRDEESKSNGKDGTVD